MNFDLNRVKGVVQHLLPVHIWIAVGGVGAEVLHKLPRDASASACMHQVKSRQPLHTWLKHCFF